MTFKFSQNREKIKPGLTVAKTITAVLSAKSGRLVIRYLTKTAAGMFLGRVLFGANKLWLWLAAPIGVVILYCRGGAEKKWLKSGAENGTGRVDFKGQPIAGKTALLSAESG
ncbi:MAG: hypothetical protein ACUVUR_01670 [bacterium]